MTQQQKAKAWDVLKEVAHDKAASRNLFVSSLTKQTAKNLFQLMCEAEVSVMKFYPEEPMETDE